MKVVFEGLPVEIVQAEMDIPEPQSNNLRVIAKAKVRFAYEQLREPVIVQDSGFYIPSLNGFPGALVNHVLTTIGIDGIIKLVEDEERGCSFNQCLCYYDGGNLAHKPVFFESSVSGSLSPQPRGTMKDHFWSELALVFIPEGYSKTQAEMSDAEYLVVREKTSNHYAKKFSKWLMASLRR